MFTRFEDQAPEDINRIDAALRQCLEPLLKALNWKGDLRNIIESLPHFCSTLNIHRFLSVMKHLRFNYTSMNIRLCDIDPRLLPCLFVNQDGISHVLIKKENGKILVFNGETKKTTRIKNDTTPGIAYCFKTDSKVKQSIDTTHWFRNIIVSYKGLIAHIFGMSLVFNLLILGAPLFIMAVYDRVIGTHSYSMLYEFLLGIGIAITGIGLLSWLRAAVFAYVSAKLNRDISNLIFERILFLNSSLTESASIESQVARIKDFDTVREFLTGPLIITLFELPFIIIFIIIIGALGGNIIAIPLAMVGIFLLISLLSRKQIKRKITDASITNTERQEFLLEALSHIQVLKYTGLQAQWLNRHREISADAALSNLNATFITSVNNAIADFIMIAAGMTILSFGVFKVFSGTLTIGALIAIMILTWRVLAPLKMLFVTLPKLEQLIASIRQINNLMKIKPECEPGAITQRYQLQGNIIFNRVSMRYPNSANPALLGVSLKIRAGKFVAVVGKNGSGKSTLLKLIPGIYLPQAGSIQIDSHDIRQLNPLSLRQSIGFVTQTPQLFYGTISQNMRLAEPTATDEQIKNAASDAGILNEILSLPHGFETRIRDHSTLRLSSSFQQRLSLARAYLRRGKILLLDEPMSILDHKAEKDFMQLVERLKGTTTILLVTHRPSHLKYVDEIIVLDNGHLIIHDKAEKVLEAISRNQL